MMTNPSANRDEASRRQRARRRRGAAMVGMAIGLALTAGMAAAGALPGMRSAYVDPYHAKVQAAGYVQKTAEVNGISLSYVEGPDNGPPLVLLHAQLLDWFSYSRVLPELAKSYHVYDIDYPGHGATVTPPGYAMTADRIGTDLGDFIAQEIREPVYVTGNSSGGLLAVWLAANRPAQIKAAVLEDPPLFSAEYPRIQQTIAYRAFQASYTAATKDHPDDFLLYWIRNNAAFFRKKVGPGTPFLLTQAVRGYRKANPGKPPELGLIKDDTVRMLIRGLDRYDPRFGAAFYDGSWNKGFDHAAALARIECPVLLMQADYTMLPDGTLNGAMTQEDADRAMSLLKHGSFIRIDATHVVNLAKPDLFVGTLNGFFLARLG
jgi:pimeloyl-ACP methyl ester carboxylesterase